MPSASALHARRPTVGRTGGFTLTQACLGLLALGLAAAIAVGEVRKFRRQAQRDVVAAELRAIATAFETYRLQLGEWPAGTHAEARVPRGMETALAKTAWLAGPPCGGVYDWLPPVKPKVEEKAKAQEKDPATPPAPPAPASAGMIMITAFSTGPELTLTDEDLQAIDAKLDDGNLATGRFRTGFNRWPVYYVNPSR